MKKRGTRSGGFPLLFYVLIIGYFMYMVYRISASLQRVAATLEQLRLERAAARSENGP